MRPVRYDVPEREQRLIFAIGCVLIAVGCVFFVKYLPLLPHFAWAGVVIAAMGAFFAFFSRRTLEAAVSRKAGEWFDAGRFGTPAQTVVFGPEKLEISSELYECRVPYEMLSGVFEGRGALLIFTAGDEWRIVPERTLDPEALGRVKALLKSKMNQKFTQEDA